MKNLWKNWTWMMSLINHFVCESPRSKLYYEYLSLAGQCTMMNRWRMRERESLNGWLYYLLSLILVGRQRIYSLQSKALAPRTHSQTRRSNDTVKFIYKIWEKVEIDLFEWRPIYFNERDIFNNWEPDNILHSYMIASSRLPINLGAIAIDSWPF